MRKVLIVDDNAFVRMGLQAAVDWAGHGMDTPCACATAEEAIAILAQEAFDAAFIDIRLPGMSGLELVGHMHEMGVGTEVVVISAYNEFEFARQCVALGVRQYLLKPIGAAELEEVLAALTRRLDERDEISQARESGEKMRALQKTLLEGYSATIRRNILAMNPAALAEDLARVKTVCAGRDALIAPILSEHLMPGEAVNPALDAAEIAALLLRKNRYLAQNDSEQIARKALVWLNEHFCEDLTLGEVAAKFALHPGYFSAVLKAECGLAFSDYIIRARMDKARALLALKIPAGEVAARVGYKNYKSFYKTYKNYFGHAPSEAGS